MKRFLVVMVLLLTTGCFEAPLETLIVENKKIDYQIKNQDILTNTSLSDLSQIGQPNFHGSKFYFSEVIQNGTVVGSTKEVYCYDVETRKTELIFDNKEDRRIYDIIHDDDSLLIVTIVANSDGWFEVEIIKYHQDKEDVLDSFTVTRPLDAPEFKQHQDEIYILYQKVISEDMIAGDRITQFARVDKDQIHVLFEDTSSLLESEWLHIGYNAVISADDKVYFYLTRMDEHPLDSLVYMCSDNLCNEVKQLVNQPHVINALSVFGDDLFYVGRTSGEDYELYLYKQSSKELDHLKVDDKTKRYFEKALAAMPFSNDEIIVKVRSKAEPDAQFALLKKENDSVVIDLIKFTDNEHVNCYPSQGYAFCVGFSAAFTLSP